MAEGTSSENAVNNMDSSETPSPDIQNLSISLSENFKTLRPLSKDRCIYRVPQTRRRLNPSDYTPHMVSIGPIHHGKKELQPMEEHKTRYSQYFLQRTKVRIEAFLTLIKDKETILHNCYADIVELESDKFVRMILVDAFFLIELFLRGFKTSLVTDDDVFFGKPWINIWCDLSLVENQLPLFILNDVFNLAKTATHGGHYEGLSLITITCWFWEGFLIPIDKNSLETHFSEAKHFADLLRLCLKPSQEPAQSELKAQNIPSVMELHQAGVKFVMSGSSKNAFDLTFNKGVLEIPFLKAHDETERLYRNILAFEFMHGLGDYFNDYVLIMSYLINSTKSAELLIQSGVAGQQNSETLSTVFNKLSKDCAWSLHFQYSGLVEDLNAYCRRPWQKWKAILERNYFNSPWASISVIAAVILLALTFIQAVCSIIPL